MGIFTFTAQYFIPSVNLFPTHKRTEIANMSLNCKTTAVDCETDYYNYYLTALLIHENYL